MVNLVAGRTSFLESALATASTNAVQAGCCRLGLSLIARGIVLHAGSIFRRSGPAQKLLQRGITKAVGLPRKPSLKRINVTQLLPQYSPRSNAVMSGKCKVVCHHGEAALTSFLARPDHENFWDLKLEELIDWLGALYRKKKEGDPIFEQRCQITSIKKQHRSKLAEIEHTLGKCAEAYQRCVNHDRLESLISELQKARLAEAGLTAYLLADEDGDSSALDVNHKGADRTADKQESRQKDKLTRARQKLAEIHFRIGPLEQELEDLCKATAEWQELQRANSALVALRTEIGLTAAEDRLQTMFKDTGAQSQSSGKDFEAVCTDVLKDCVIPQVAKAVNEHRVEVLSNVTLGMANGEIDKVIVCLPESAADPVSVLAVAECKNNINDLAHGFSMMQQNIGWLSGEKDGPHAYDPEAWKTRKYTKGHFDRTAVHHESGSEYVFGPSSFQAFVRDAEEGCFLEGVYFITRPGTLTGLSSAEINMISHRLATGMDFQEALESRSVSYFEKLLGWVKKAREGKLSSIDILKMYQRRPMHANKILLVDLTK